MSPLTAVLQLWAVCHVSAAVSCSSNKPVLVTGASGYISSHVVKQLLAAGCSVLGTVRSAIDSTSYDFLRRLPGAQERLQLAQADLVRTAQEDWNEAAEGCDFCIHTASPFLSTTPDNETEAYLLPAIRGTEVVIRACARAGVKRIVLTSSVSAVEGNAALTDPRYVVTENDWTEPESVGPYERSKTLAERRAWELAQELGIELAVINPAFVFGPVLSSSHTGTSVEVVQSFFNLLRLPAVPDIRFHMVDVRDVAEVHIQAMIKATAKNERFICAATPVSVPMLNMTRILAPEFGQYGYWIPTWSMPYGIWWALAIVDKGVAVIKHRWGVWGTLDIGKVQRVLGVSLRQPEEALLDMAHSLVQHGLLPRRPGYSDPLKTRGEL